MVRTIYLKKSVLHESGAEWKARIEELGKKIESYRQADRALAREEAEMAGRIAGLKLQQDEGRILIRDQKRVESDVRQFSQELEAIRAKRSENGKATVAVQAEVTELKETFEREVFVLDLPEPAKPKAPEVHNAMSQIMGKTIGEKKEEKTPVDSVHPHHLTSRG